MANILEIKTENFKLDKNMLCLSGNPAKGASIVLFRAFANSQQAIAISKKEFDIFRNTGLNWDQAQRRLGFFVIDIASAPKLVKSSLSTNTSLNTASSLCIFYYNGMPFMILKKIPYDNPYEVRTFCLKAFEKIERELAPLQQHPQHPQQNNEQRQRKTYMPEGLTMPSTSSLKHTKNSYTEETLIMPPDIIPYNTPWLPID